MVRLILARLPASGMRMRLRFFSKWFAIGFTVRLAFGIGVFLFDLVQLGISNVFVLSPLRVLIGADFRTTAGIADLPYLKFNLLGSVRGPHSFQWWLRSSLW